MGTAKKPGFSLGEVEAIIGAMQRIDPTKRATFSARLQQLQRMGVPRGANLGRGKRIRYEFWQVAEFALCVDLLDVGVPPGLIKTHFGEAGVYSALGFGQKVERCPPSSKDGLYLFLELHALEHLRSPNTERQAEHAADHVMKFGSAQHLIEDDMAPAIAINLSKRLADLKAAVAAVMPSHVDEATFPELPARPGMIA